MYKMFVAYHYRKSNCFLLSALLILCEIYILYIYYSLYVNIVALMSILFIIILLFIRIFDQTIKNVYFLGSITCLPVIKFTLYSFKKLYFKTFCKKETIGT